MPLEKDIVLAFADGAPIPELAEDYKGQLGMTKEQCEWYVESLVRTWMLAQGDPLSESEEGDGS